MIVVESDDINVVKEQRDQYREQVERLTELMTPLTTENAELKEQIEKLQYNFKIFKYFIEIDHYLHQM